MAQSPEDKRAAARDRQRELRSTEEGRRAWNDRHNAWAKDARRRVRLLVLETYGGECACCGEAEEAFLVIDHVDGGGNAHREEIKPSATKGRGGGGIVLYKWLIANDFPPGFQVLCANCNMAKDRPGGCPHQREEVGNHYDGEEQ